MLIFKLNFKQTLILLILVLLTASSIEVTAQSSVHYKIKKTVLSEAGLPSTSSLFKLDDCVGQPSPVGVSTGANYALSAGFLAAANVLQVNPILSVNPTTLSFGASQTSLNFQISNIGGGALTWTAAESPDKSWITSVNPVSGAGNGTVEVKVDRSGLSAGNYAGTIKVSSNGGDLNVTVNMTVAGNLPVVKFNPKSSNMRVGNPASVDIVIENITGLGSFEFEISYDGAIVQIAQSSDVVLGPFLGSTGRTTIPLSPSIDNSTGSVVFAAASVGTQGGAAGNGVLATITWTPQTDGTTTLDLKNVKVSDIQGAQLQVIEEDGEINVTSRFWADIDGDNDIDVFDVQLVAAHWNTKVGDANYDPIYDVDNKGQGDGDVDVFDVQLVASWWNKPIPPNSLSKPVDGRENSWENTSELQAASLRIYPEYTENSGKPATLVLQVANAVDLAGFQFDLSINKNQTPMPKITLGGFLASSGNKISALGPRRNNSGNKLTFGAFSLVKNKGAAGTGVLARIQLGKGTDFADGLTFENFLLVDSRGRQLKISAVNNEYSNLMAQTRLPTSFSLMQNYPNPFNPETSIRFELPANHQSKSPVRLLIYNLKGQLIRKLVTENKEPGAYTVLWNGTNERGEPVPSGLYVYTLSVDHFKTSKKMLFLK